MRIWAIAIVALLTLGVAAVLVAPSFIDWNSYRPEIAARLQETLGRRVDIDGDLSVTLLPVPALSAGKVRLANVPGAADPDMATIETVRLQLAPAALLQGAITIDSLVLVRPAVHLQRFPDGRANWQFQSGGQTAGVAGAEGASAGRGGVRLQVDKLVIQDGAIALRQPDAEIIRVDDVNATLSAVGPEGPYHANGTAAWNRVRAQYELSTGRFNRGNAPVSVSLRLPDRRAETRFSGQMALSPALEVRGKLSVTADNLSEVISLVSDMPTLPVRLDRPLAVEGALEATENRVGLNDMSVRLGDTDAKGALGVQLEGQPAIDLAMIFNRIDMDELAGGESPDDRPASAEQATHQVSEAGFRLPAGFTVAADLAADVIVYRGAIIRQAKLEAGLAGGVLSVGRATALLPGGSDIGMSGRVQPSGSQLAVDGAFEAASDNLRVVLQWLGVTVPEAPADRLRKFSAIGKLRGSLGELQLTDLDVRLDTSRLRGAANLRLAGRPAVGANLVVDNLNVDAYRPSEGGPRADTEAQPSAAGAPRLGDGLGAALDAFDANVRARVDMLTMNEVGLRDVSLDGSLVHGNATLRQFSVGDFGGASAQVSGTVNNLAAGPVTVGDLRYDIHTRQPAKMMRLLGIQPGFDAGRLGEVSIRGSADGALRDLRLSGQVGVAGGEVTIAGTIDTDGQAPSLVLDVAATHPSFPDLVRVFAPDYRPGGRLGKASASAKIRGQGLTIAAENLRATIGASDVSGTVTADLAGKPAISAHLDFSEVVVDDYLPPQRAALLRSPSEWLVAPMTPQPVATRVVAEARSPALSAAAPWSRDPLPLGWLGEIRADVAATAKAVTYDKYRFDNVKVSAKVADGAATVEALTASLFGGPLAASGRLSSDGTAESKLSVEGVRLKQALKASEIHLTSGLLSGRAALSTRGQSSAEMVANLGGEGQWTVRDGAIQGFDLPDVSRRVNEIENAGSLLRLLEAGMGGGQTRFSNFAATFSGEHGQFVSRDIALQADGGQGEGTATIDLPAYTLDSRLAFTLSDHPGMPPFGLRLQGPLDAPRRIVEANELQAWLVAKGVGRLLKGKGGETGKLIENLLGAEQGKAPDQSPPPRTAPPAPAEKNKPEEVLKGLLQELGRQQAR